MLVIELESPVEVGVEVTIDVVRESRGRSPLRTSRV